MRSPGLRKAAASAFQLCGDARYGRSLLLFDVRAHLAQQPTPGPEPRRSCVTMGDFVVRLTANEFWEQEWITWGTLALMGDSIPFEIPSCDIPRIPEVPESSKEVFVAEHLGGYPSGREIMPKRVPWVE